METGGPGVPEPPEFRLLAMGSGDHRSFGELSIEDQTIRSSVDCNHFAVVQFAIEQLHGERIEHLTLDQALERSGSENRIVAAIRQPITRSRRRLQNDLPIGEAFGNMRQLDIDDSPKILSGEWFEDEHFVDPVQEFRPEELVQRLVHLSPHSFPVELVESNN